MELIGMTKEDALELLEEKGTPFRIRSEDGLAFIGTADVRKERVNLTIEDGFIVDVRLG